MKITLDTFFQSETPQEAIDLAAALGTELVTDGDSVWRGEPFGSAIEELRAMANPALAIELEIQRVLRTLGLEGTVETRDEGQAVHLITSHVTIEV